MTSPASAAATDDTVTVAGLRLGMTSFGTGDAVVVLFPAFLMSRHMQHRWAESLATRGYRVITVDLIGDRDPTSIDAGVTGLGQQVLAVLDELGLQRAVLGGTSIGASAVLQAAITAPHRVSALVLEGPFLERGTARTKALMVVGQRLLRWGAPLLRVFGRAAGRRAGDRHPLLSLAQETVLRDPARSRDFVARMLTGPILPDLAALSSVDTPALVIALRADPAHPAADAAGLHARLPNSTLLRGGTLAQLRLRPETITPAIARFLDSAAAAPS